MRLLHTSRSSGMITFLICTLFLAVLCPAFGLTIEYPTEGRTVRDQVRIVVPRSSLPVGVAKSGFLTIKIDGRFTAAVSTADRGATTADGKIVYIWDTKSLINDPLLPKDQRNYKDGRHAIVVEAHALEQREKDAVATTSTVNVVLQNQVPRPNPAPDLKLRYRYHLGQQSEFKINVTGEILDNNGYSLTGGQPPILGEFHVTQSVEDVRHDSSALLRYKVQKNAFTQVFGQVTLLGYPVSPFKSLYKIVDPWGLTLEDNVLSTKSDVEVTDILVRLPDRPVQVGETWDTGFRIKLEGMSETADLLGQSKLEGIEWEGGFKCAKIVSKLNGAVNFSFLPGGVSIPATATSTAYFAFEPGKLIKDTILFEFGTTLDNSLLEMLQPQQVSTQGNTSGTVGPAGMPPGMGPGPMPGMRAPGPGPMYTPASGASASGVSQDASTTTPVKIKLTVSRNLVRQ